MTSTAAKAPYVPTPEQLAVAEQRRQKRLEKKLLQQENAQLGVNQTGSSFLPRPWITLPSSADSIAHNTSIKVMTWNLLAQCLVRRELFPTSDKALKAGEREPMIHSEILSHSADILCMQEVDRLEKLVPMLERAGYSSTYASGVGKKHGCLIAYRTDRFEKVAHNVIAYDKVSGRQSNDGEPNLGLSHTTKNIGSVVALRDLSRQSAGFIVATTHLFWHPAYTYERVRQAGILFREVLAFRELGGYGRWPCIVAGDFNFAPDDPAYLLLAGEPLAEDQLRKIQASRVVHVSVDPSVPKTQPKAEDEEGEGGGSDPDRVINNARPATTSDHLLSDEEFTDLYALDTKVRSAYDEGQRMHLQSQSNAEQEALTCFGPRASVPPSRSGAYEPIWTSYTHYWKTTLDYIFFLDALGSKAQTAGYLSAHRTVDVEAGLPKTGVCGSDHFSLCAELHYTTY